MACFLVSATVGIGTAVARHIVKHHEKKLELEGKAQLPEKFGSDVKWSKKLGYLELTLFSGSFVLALEHILHGEVVPFPPFLTAAQEGSEAVQEMIISNSKREKKAQRRLLLNNVFFNNFSMHHYRWCFMVLL